MEGWIATTCEERDPEFRLPAPPPVEPRDAGPRPFYPGKRAKYVTCALWNKCMDKDALVPGV